MSIKSQGCNSKAYTSQTTLYKPKKVHEYDVRFLCYPFNTYEHNCLEGCEVSFKSRRDMRQHLQRKHRILTQQVIHEFESTDEFLSWKEDLNKNDTRNYINSCEQKTTGDLQISHYHCHPIEIDSSIVSEQKCKISSKSGDIIHRSCTSEMIVVKNLKSNIVAVTYFKTHYGHQTEILYPTKTSTNLISKSYKFSLKIPKGSLRKSDEANMNSQWVGRRREKKIKRRINRSIHSANEDDTPQIGSSEIRCNKKTVLKKDIIYLLQQLSENNFEKYDENTLSQVKETLHECCYFLSSYETSEDLQSIDQSPSEPPSSPPLLVWYPPKND